MATLQQVQLPLAVGYLLFHLPDGRDGDLVVENLLDVEEEHGLFLGGGATIGETLPHFLEHRTELAAEEGR